MSFDLVPDPPSRAKRLKRVDAGVEACRRWLLDAVEAGVSGFPDAAAHAHMQARLVDAQAPGIARMVERLGALLAQGPEGATHWVKKASVLMLFLETFERRNRLPSDFQEELHRSVGFTTRKDDIPPDRHFRDNWHVLAQRIYVEDKITVQRSWVYGEITRRWQVHYSYSVMNQPFAPNLRVGSALTGTLGIYPGVLGLRGAFLEMEPTDFRPPTCGTIHSCLTERAKLLSLYPWLEATPLGVQISAVELTDKGAILVDEHGDRLAVNLREHGGWRLAAMLSRGPVQVFGEQSFGLNQAICAASEGCFEVL